MPILLLILFAVVGLEWLKSDCCPLAGDADSEIAFQPPARSWQDRCRDRLDAARSEAATDGAFIEFARGELRTADSPGGPGGIWYRLELPTGVRYGAGVSARQEGDIPDVDWYSLNGAVEPDRLAVWKDGAVEPAERLSMWKDAGGRSGFVGANDGDALRRTAFQLVFQRAIDDCMEMDE
jgi:hypothetical protein